MTIDEILEHWARDTKIDDLQLDMESIKISSYHRKYIGFLVQERLVLKSLKHSMKSLRRLLRIYFAGEATQEDLDTLGREQFRGKTMKSDIPDRVEYDDLVIEKDARIDFQSEKVDLLLDIMRSVHGRGFQLQTAVAHRKIMVGA